MLLITKLFSETSQFSVVSRKFVISFFFSSYGRLAAVRCTLIDGTTRLFPTVTDGFVTGLHLSLSLHSTRSSAVAVAELSIKNNAPVSVANCGVAHTVDCR